MGFVALRDIELLRIDNQIDRCYILTMNNAMTVLEMVMANDEDIRAKFRAMQSKVAPVFTGAPLTVKEQDDRNRRLRYKPWTLTGERDADLVTVTVVE